MRLPTKKSKNVRSDPTPVQFDAPPAVDWKPHTYQRRAVKFLIEHAAGALFLDPG